MHISDWSSDVCSSDVIAAAIAERLSEDDPPEFVMVMPETADGWLEQMAMDAARVQLVREIAKAKHGDRLKVYYPRTAKGEAIYRSEEHTSELQSLMRISYAVFCLKKKNRNKTIIQR